MIWSKNLLKFTPPAKAGSAGMFELRLSSPLAIVIWRKDYEPALRMQ